MVGAGRASDEDPFGSDRMPRERIGLAAGIGEFEEIAREHRPYLYNFLRVMCGDRFDADDLVQDTLIRAYEKKDTFRNESSVRTWLTRIAINVFLSSRRRARPHRSMSLEKLVIRESPDEPERLVERREFQWCVYHTLFHHVPERYRTALILRDVHGASYEEMTKALGCTAQAARLKVHRGRKSFREHFVKGKCYAFTRDYACICEGVKGLGAGVAGKVIGDKEMAGRLLGAVAPGAGSRLLKAHVGADQDDRDPVRVDPPLDDAQDAADPLR